MKDSKYGGNMYIILVYDILSDENGASPEIYLKFVKNI